MGIARIPPICAKLGLSPEIRISPWTTRSGADMDGADLAGTELEGTDLATAKNLTQSQLDDAIYDKTPPTLPDGLTPRPRIFSQRSPLG